MTGSGGNFFEDFRLGQVFEHGPPRTLDDGDRALYHALYGMRFAPQAAHSIAQGIGLEGRPLDELLIFHAIFGKSVPDISLNAIANLGYAEVHFLKPVFAGVTIRAQSRVIGLKENANRETGVVYVRTEGFDQANAPILSFIRWVMVRKRNADSPAPDSVVPAFASVLEPYALSVPFAAVPLLKPHEAGGARFFDDYETGERIDHADGMTVEEGEHMLATRLYHNTARVHFNQHAEAQGRFGKRIVYGGHVISIARALSFNGLANAWFIAGINSGRHVAPCFAGDTVYAWSEVLDRKPAHGRTDAGFLRLRTIALKNRPAAGFPGQGSDGRFDADVILDLDYWAVLPRRP